MLLLTRRIGESIIISLSADQIYELAKQAMNERKHNDDEVLNMRITVCRVNGSQVLIGSEAPKSIAVNREEIHTKIINNLPHQKGN